jgi:hypothetical protein
MLTLIAATAAVFAIIFAVPLAVYGAAAAAFGLELPSEASPQRFMIGVAITKLGTAAAFVGLLQLGAPALAGRWLLYATLWFAMFAASEIGDAVAGRSSWTDAGLGVVSEGVYAPASALAAFAMLGLG